MSKGTLTQLIPPIVGLTIAITEVAPSPQALGSTVSLFLANATLMRAFAPALATSILAYGIDRHVAGGQLVWIVLGLCTAVLGTYIRTLPNFKELKDSRDRQSQTEAEETHEA